MQGIWSASVNDADPVVKPLYSDAGNGILFNFSSDLVIDDEIIPEGVIILPVSKQAKTVALPPGAHLAGIRFHPAVGYGVLRQHLNKPTLLVPEQDQMFNLYQVFSELQTKLDNDSRIEILYQWVDENLNFTDVIPDSVEKGMKAIEQGKAPGKLNESIALSQRQMERQFKLWLDMTPKYYQRILRIKKTINFLRENKDANLAEVAVQFGFSDQAHMTREFRTIASITPGKFEK